MRKRDITSYRKLPTLCLIVLLSMLSNTVFAKDKARETNITCYAGSNKWICASDKNNQAAENKAKALNSSKESEVQTSDVVIKPLSLPKFSQSRTKSTKNTKPAISSKAINPQAKVQRQVTENTVESTKKYVKQQNKPIEQPIEQQIKPADYHNYWSYQLVGVSTENSAQKYVKQLSDYANEIYIIQTSHNDMDWWVVIYGLYASKSEALNNQDNLPTTSTKPWLRPLKNLEIIAISTAN